MTLTSEQQQEYLQAVRKGASPLQACTLIGVTTEALQATEEADPEFAAAVDEVGVLLSQNAAAKLYREGMEGNVSALTFLLKNRPPPEWTRRDPLGMSDDELDNLSDDELLKLLEWSGRMLEGIREWREAQAASAESGGKPGFRGNRVSEREPIS